MSEPLYHIVQDPVTNRFITTLMGGEFDNCHGYGDTHEAAVSSLKLEIRARRRQSHGLSER